MTPRSPAGVGAVIHFLKERPPASPEELAVAEERLAAMGLRIPPSYRAFLTERDGGWHPVECAFAFYRGQELDEGSYVHGFLGVAPVTRPEMNLLDVAVALVPERLPTGILAIADDPMGNHVCLDGREGRDGPVLFWDHEEEPEEPEDPSNLYFVAPDLASFLDALTELPPLPAEPASWRSPFDWRRLLRTRR